MQGVFKKYKPESGYGFIAGEDNNDYFVHKSSIKNLCFGRNPKSGDRVTFKPGITEKGLCAIEVFIV